MATIQEYKEQVQAIKAGADADAASEQTKIDGLKASLKSEQTQQQADNLVSAAMAELAAQLDALLPPSIG